MGSLLSSLKSQINEDLSFPTMGLDENLGRLTQQELDEAAKNQWGENNKILESSVADLKTWISKSPHLHSIQKNDEFLRTFLRGCKFSLERTKEKIDNFHAVKGTLPEWFMNWDVHEPGVQEVIKSGAYLPMPGYDKHGRFVIFMRMGQINPAKVTFDTMMRAAQIIITSAIKDDEQTVIKGFVMVQDLKGVGANHVTMMNIASLKKMITMMETAWPLKPKAEHIVNMPGIMDSLFKIANSMMKQKMQDRIHVHTDGDLTKIQEDLGKDVLPVEYGGNNGTLEELKAYMAKKVEEEADFLKNISKFKTDEAKRPGKPKSHSDLFGIEGSFRKLEID